MITASGVGAADVGGTSAAPPAIVPEAMAADLVAAWAELGNVHKGQTADAVTYTYRYADLGDLLDMARPILAKHDLALIQPLTRFGAPVMTVHTMLIHSSGAVLSWGFDVQTGTTPQATGSAITYARRYSAAAALGVGFDDDDDDGKQASMPPKKQAPRQETAPVVPTPAQTKKLMADFNRLGIRERRDRLDVISAILGRNITSWANVSDPKEVGHVLDQVAGRIADLDGGVEVEDIADSLWVEQARARSRDRIDEEEGEPRVDTDWPADDSNG